MYMGAQVDSNTIANISGLIETFPKPYFAFQVHFKPSRVYNLKAKGDLIKKITLHDRLRNTCELYTFLQFWIFIVAK